MSRRGRSPSSTASARATPWWRGVLHGWLQGDLAQGLRYGVLTAALCLTHYGDAVYVTRAELDDLLERPHRDITR